MSNKKGWEDAINLAQEFGRITGENDTLRARIAELEAQQRAWVPEGFVLVPVEPTREMLDAYVAVPGRFHSGASDWAAMIAAAPAPKAQEQPEARILRTVAETRRETGGSWEECTGCVEREDGHMVGSYPCVEAFRCHLGGGCSECGGIGAVWREPGYYEGLVEAMERVEQAPQPAEVGANEREAFEAWVKTHCDYEDMTR